jgi:hypothetical protein
VRTSKEADVLAGVGVHAVVYQVLDEVLAGANVPAGARGTLFSVIDELRATNGDAEETRRAERIAIELHKLEWGLRQGDASSSQEARNHLKALAAEWINTRISSRH